MVRTQIYIGDAEKAELEALARKRGVTMAGLIRKGIEAVLEESRISAQSKMVDDLYGLWSDRDDIPDAETYVREIRRSSRPIVSVFSEKPVKYAARKKKHH